MISFQGILSAFPILWIPLLCVPLHVAAQEPYLQISGRIYLDHNRNGFEDGYDFGYPAVAVHIYADINQNGVLDEDDPELGYAVSGPQGQFSHADLPLLHTGYFAVPDRRDLPAHAIINPGKIYFHPETSGCLDFGFQAEPAICYAVGDGSSPDSLMIINTISGRSVPFGGNLGTRYIEAMCLMPGGKDLFAVDKGRFGKINLQTGRFISYTGDIGMGSGQDGSIAFDDTDGLAFDPIQKRLYATAHRNNAPDLLYQIDTLTGRFVPDGFGKGWDYLIIRGERGITDIADIAVSPVSGRLYGISHSGYRGGPNYLVIIDPNTGNTYVVDTLKYEGNRLDDVEGLGFNNDGELYATTGGNAGEQANTLFRINLVSAAATKVGQFSHSSDFESCDCMVARPNEIRGRVFEDLNDNRAWDPGEKGLAGVAVYISPDRRQKDVEGQTFATAKVLTDGEGHFSWRTFANRDFVLRLDEDRITETYAYTGGHMQGVSLLGSVGGEISDFVDFGLKHNSFLAEWLELVNEVPVSASGDPHMLASSSDVPEVSVSFLSPEEMKPRDAHMQFLRTGEAIFYRMQLLEGAGLTKREGPAIHSEYDQHVFRMGTGKAAIDHILTLLPPHVSVKVGNHIPLLTGKTCNLQVSNTSKTILMTLYGH